jgi:integrase
LREREHLTDAEVERLIEAAKANRHGVRDALMVLMDYRYGLRDALMVLMAYRHGLRAAEVTDLKWEAVDFDRGEMHVNRLKGGLPHRSGAARTSQAQARQSAVDPVRVRVRARGAPIG